MGRLEESLRKTVSQFFLWERVEISSVFLCGRKTINILCPILGFHCTFGSKLSLYCILLLPIACADRNRVQVKPNFQVKLQAGISLPLFEVNFKGWNFVVPFEQFCFFLLSKVISNFFFLLEWESVAKFLWRFIIVSFNNFCTRKSVFKLCKKTYLNLCFELYGNVC